PSSVDQGKSWKACFNFAKGNRRFGDSCRYVHDANARVPNATSGFNKGRGTSENSTNDLLNKLLTQLGKLGMNIPSPTAPTGPSASPGFPMPAQVSLYYTVGPSQSTSNSGQATVSPHAFTTGTLQDPSSGSWNMDTGAISHLNNSITSLSIVLNSCMYSTVSIDGGHSIPVTNTGHSILSTPLKSLRLNNVLITPHIDFKTRRVILRCDSTGDLYPVITPSPIPHVFLCVLALDTKSIQRLISLRCKKQTMVANSTTEAEYVAASSCYGQVLWIQNLLLDYG
ncbi:ribonuclease H-like domain-containing protein, partial [Tanacetum coccineum]